MSNVNPCTPSIFIQVLADYNAGRIVGEWIDLTETTTPEELDEKIQSILAQSQDPHAEEVEIADTDDFCGLDPTITNCLEIAAKLAEHGEAFALYASDRGEHNADTDGFEDAYCGIAESEADYAEDLCTDCYDMKAVPEFLRYCIDWERVARDLFMSDYWSERDSAGVLHIFRHI